MKSLLNFLIICLINTLLLSSQDVNNIDNIKYKKTTFEENQMAKEVFSLALEKDSAELVFDNLCYIGPILWLRYKNIPVLNNITGGNITFKVPQFNSLGKRIKENKLNGKLIQRLDDFKLLWYHLKIDLIDDSISFSKLTKNQIRYYWSVNFYDIEEPVFIVSNSVFKFLIQFSPRKFKILWIDEVFE